jgi:hypothetical protein
MMYIYNVTVHIEKQTEEQWLEWIRVHIPQVLATQKFQKATLSRVLAHEEGGVTYAIQYQARSREDLNAYYEDHAPELRKEGEAMFGTAMVGFRTELQILEEF